MMVTKGILLNGVYATNEQTTHHQNHTSVRAYMHQSVAGLNCLNNSRIRHSRKPVSYRTKCTYVHWCY
jgi:hypothetical protein